MTDAWLGQLSLSMLMTRLRVVGRADNNCSANSVCRLLISVLHKKGGLIPNVFRWSSPPPTFPCPATCSSGLSHDFLALAIYAASPSTTFSPRPLSPEIDSSRLSPRHPEGCPNLVGLSQGIASAVVASCRRRAAERIRATTCLRATL